jgi:hypothetical protein
MAQIINVNRPGPGLVSSGVRDITGQVAADTDYVLTGSLQAADLADTGLTCTYELRLDGQPAWGPNAWVGGTRDRNNVLVPPMIQYSTGRANLPTSAEARYTFNKQLAGRFTVDLAFVPAAG